MSLDVLGPDPNEFDPRLPMRGCWVGALIGGGIWILVCGVLWLLARAIWP